MAITIADVATPNAAQTSGLNQFKWRFKDITFDNSYPTTGEVVTATQVNLNMLVGVIPGLAVTSDGAAALPVYGEVNSTGSQATLQIYRYDGASAGKASLEEAANTFDASTFTVRLWFFGH